jgi:hypothetical protein
VVAAVERLVTDEGESGEGPWGITAPVALVA